MAATYCDETDVEKILGKPAGFFGVGTTPLKTEVNEMIEEVEDEINAITNHSWKSITVTEEYYDIPYLRFRRWNTGIPIKLRHRDITTLGGSDKVEVWNGSSYDDYVATKVEDRASDFWLDYTKGWLFLKSYPSYYRRDLALRMTYRYGATGAINPIKTATALMVAIKILQSDDKTMTLNETGDPTRLPYDPRISQWKARANRILSIYKEIRVF